MDNNPSSIGDRQTEKMEDVPVAFDKFRLSVLLKAVSISPSVDGTTLGPNSSPPRSSPQENPSENNQNSANISPPRPSKSPGAKPKPSTFSIEKILYENELQRREEVLKAVNRRKKDMEAFQERLQREKEVMLVELAAKREREMAAEKAKQEAEERRFAQQDELKRRHEAQLQAQRLQERQEKLKRETDEHRRLKEHEECLEKIVSCRGKFTESYTEIGRLATSLIKNKNLIGQVVGPFTSKLKEFSTRIDGIIEGGKTGGLTRNEVNDVESVLREAEEIFTACRAEVTRINDECLRREQEMLAQNTASGGHGAPDGVPRAAPDGVDGRQLEKSTEGSSNNEPVEAPRAPEGNPRGLEESVAVKGIQVYLNSKSYLERYRGAFRQLEEVDPDRRYRMDCEKKLNILVKGISQNFSSLKEIVRKFGRNFEGKGPAELAFVKNCVAETIVDEVKDFAEQKFGRIYALAAVVVSLWSQYPDFGDLVLSYLHIHCPYIIPVVMPRFQGQSDENFYSSRGYTYSNGVREHEEAFLKRMEKFMRFYAAIIITKLPKGSIPRHPHGLANAWRWLATILNAQPRQDAIEIYPRLIKVFLESTGHAMLQWYPTQFRKLLRVVAEDYCSLLAQRADDANAPVDVLKQQHVAITLLKRFVTDVIAKDSIPPPDGQLSGNFW
ncbi:nucleoporin GLE1 [Diachasma alloeum]|uniref:nucleoporin GLE1 n=1 Tax=Diachasma alloeum TaxID=454923 RepID=UPI00073840C2|nr:nucleoporin GLE1 [Diachasma alloeum]